MGQDEQQLDVVFQKIYYSKRSLHATGQYKAEAGKGLISKLVALLIGIPIHTDYQPATLFIDRKAKHEIWNRNFGGKKFSTQFYDSGNFKIEQVAFLKVYFRMIFGKSVCYDGAGFGVGPLRTERFVKIISNNYPINDYEWAFEVIIQNKKSDLIFKYGGRMKIEREE